MNRNIAQETEYREDGHIYLSYDWFPAPIPENLYAGDKVYLDTMYSFAGFHSRQPYGFDIGYASGNYLHSHFLSGEKGKIEVGEYVILEATNIMANDSIKIGSHCMFSWGSYITDSWLNENTFSPERRKELLAKTAERKDRYLEIPDSLPVVIDDNVWVGFDAVILPGVHLGRGSVVGCKTVIKEDVPPYAVVAGQPARIIKFLEPNDTEQNKA